jgi:hypothetical protein
VPCAKNHLKDPYWHLDLIWKHLHEDATKSKSIHWYQHMDPKGMLDDRHSVYEMLVEQPDHSAPSTNEIREQSMMPWNQLHPGMKTAFKTKYACGSVVKITFQKYMGWGGADPVERDVGKKGFDAVEFIVRNLINGRPVRARTADTRYGHHFVGIVGARTLEHLPAKRRNKFEFLYIDPWAGNGTPIKYAGATTSFLGIIHEEGDKLKYGLYDVNTVGGHIA